MRGFFNLTDDSDSVLILREDRFDPATETRVPLTAGSRLVVDTQRLWHALWHVGDRPRHGLITSWESGPELQAYVDERHGASVVTSAPLDRRVAEDAEIELHRRLEERRRIFEAQGRMLVIPVPNDL